MSGERPVSSEQTHLDKVDEAGGEPHLMSEVTAPAGVLDVSKLNESLREPHKNAADKSKSDQATTSIVSAVTPRDPKQEYVPKNTLPSGIHNFTCPLVRK